MARWLAVWGERVHCGGAIRSIKALRHPFDILPYHARNELLSHWNCPTCPPARKRGPEQRVGDLDLQEGPVLIAKRPGPDFVEPEHEIVEKRRVCLRARPGPRYCEPARDTGPAPEADRVMAVESIIHESVPQRHQAAVEEQSEGEPPVRVIDVRKRKQQLEPAARLRARA